MRHGTQLSAIFAIMAIGGVSAAAQDAPTNPVPSATQESEARTAAAEARTAEANARKAEAEASAAALRAQLGGLANYEIQGTTTASDNAGQIEGTILSLQSTQRIAASVILEVCEHAPELCEEQINDASPVSEILEQTVAEGSTSRALCGELPPTGSEAVKLYIVPDAETLTFDTTEAVQAALCGMQLGLEKAIDDSERLTNGSGSVALAPAAILTAASAAASLFRSDYAFQGIAITPDDLLFARTLAAVARERVSAPIMLPTVYQPAALTSDNPLVAAVRGLNQKRNDAARLLQGHRVTAASLSRRGTRFRAQAEAQIAVAEQLDRAIKLLDDYLTRITSPSETGVSVFAEAARQARIRADLQAGAMILSVKVNAAGGSAYTKRNFWTFWGSAPFYVSGGTVASFTLLNGATGEVITAGAMSDAGAFQRIGDLHRDN